MTPIITEITVDLTPKFNLATVKASQYDNNSRLVICHVVNGGEPYDMTGLTARVEGTRQDGAAFLAVCTISESQAAFYITSDMTGSPGKHPAELVLVGTDNNRIGSMNFSIQVEAAPLDENESITQEDRTLMEQYIEQIEGTPAYIVDGGTFDDWEVSD